MPRSVTVIFLLFWTVATDLAMRPLYATGQSTLDIPLLFLFWVAMRETPRLTYSAWVTLVALRVIGSAESLVVAVVPSLAIVTLLLVCRAGLNVREVSTRVLWVSIATLLFQFLDVTFRWSEFSDGLLVATEGALIAGLSAFVLIPILDVVGPPRRDR